MTDRKLLELAAKAAGDEVFGEAGCYFRRLSANHSLVTGWNPLTDDGDAQRLAVKLGIKVTPYPVWSEPKHSVIASKRVNAPPDDDENTYTGPEEIELYGDDPYAATRRAIVRAAAAIGVAKHD
jgi:hypothetical protein